jgi:hypothetical protein
MASFRQTDFNPYEPPNFVESVADDELADGGIFVPSWGRVIANAALVSIFLGIVPPAASILSNGVLLFSLLILMPLSFSWHFRRTYRLPYRSVPKFGSLPFVFVFMLFMLILFSTVFTLLMSRVASSLQPEFAAAIGGAAIVVILCLAMDLSLSQFVPRKFDAKKTLLFPVAIGFVSILFWLPLAYLEDHLFGNMRTPMRGQQMLGILIATIAFATAVFYSLIMAYPTVRDRMLSAISDPRQFTKRDFQL